MEKDSKSEVKTAPVQDAMQFARRPSFNSSWFLQRWEPQVLNRGEILTDWYTAIANSSCASPSLGVPKNKGPRLSRLNANLLNRRSMSV